MARIFALTIILALAGQASAQETYEHGTTSRGRLRDPSIMLRARDAIESAGVSCQVRDAMLRGRDGYGSSHFEVTCSDGPGYIVVGAPEYRAISCLAFAEGGRLDRGSDGCRLGGNRNHERHFARMGRAAGVPCSVDGGVLVGQSPAGHPIFELSCSGPEGYWIENRAGGWDVTDCLTVTAQGGECRLTSREEQFRAFRAQLRGKDLDGCEPTDVRPMGKSGSGAFYEVECRGAYAVVLEMSPSGSLQDVIPCRDARRIGGGCLNLAEAPRRFGSTELAGRAEPSSGR